MVQESSENNFILRVLIMLEVIWRMNRLLWKHTHMAIKRRSYVNVLILARLDTPDLFIMNLHLVLQIQLLVEK